jgi:hypothetical protein
MGSLQLLLDKPLKIGRHIFSFCKNINIILALWTAVTFLRPDRNANSKAYLATFLDAFLVVTFILSITPG